MLTLNPGLQDLQTVGSEMQLMQFGSLQASTAHGSRSRRAIAILRCFILMIIRLYQFQMGNTLLDEGRKEDPVEVFQQWLQQNPDLVGRQVLTHNKLFQSCSFKYCERGVKVAVFFRRDNTPLHDYFRIFQLIQGFVDRHKCTNILPMRILSLRDFDRKQVKYEQNFAVAVRQYLHCTLQQRLQTHPALSQQQKLWFIYQMIFSTFTIHQHFNIYHGNIRTSNFLITSYQYLLLTDFAPHKPNYILQDTEQGLSEFRLFYASSVEKCNLAPEKLSKRDKIRPLQLLSPRLFACSELDDNKSAESGKKAKKNSFQQSSEAHQDLEAMKKMDIFSLGLSILEVLSNDRFSLGYEELVRAQKEGLNLKQAIDQHTSGMSNCDQLRSILKQMLQEEAVKRPSIHWVQLQFQTCIDQDIYVLFWCCLSAFNKTSFSSCDLRIHLVFSVLKFIEEEVRASGVVFTRAPPKSLSGFKSLKIFAEMLEKNLIFAPRVREIPIIERLIKHFEKTDHRESVPETEEELKLVDEDERRNFFIQSSKKSKIAKRLSFVDSFPQAKSTLCPPSYPQIQHLKETSHIPIRLTHLSLRPPRIESLLQEYKERQGEREERLRRQRYYKRFQVILKVIFSSLRGCKYTASKLLGLELMEVIGRSCSDAILLKVLLPIFMNMTQDSDITVAREAFLGFINLFYNFVDPFYNEEDIHYYEAVLQFFISIIKQSKLRLALFSKFKEIYSICEWLEIHFKRFTRQPKLQLTRLIEVIKVHYGSYSREEVRVLLSGNIPEHLLPDMFEFYISLINTDRLEGLKLSLTLAEEVSPATHRHILDAFDSCIESGLEQLGMGLFYSIRYFTIRKSTSHFIIKKIAPQVINPNKWIRDQALCYIKMVLKEYPATKNYFFFKDIFDPPFPLLPDDVQEEVLLPTPLKDSEVDLKEKKIKVQKPNITIALFLDYLRGIKASKGDRKREDEVQQWNQAGKQAREMFSFQAHIKRQLQSLYENNFLYFVLNMSAKAPLNQKEKQEKNYSELLSVLRKMGRGNSDLTSIDHQKKQMFQSFQGTINSSFEKLLAKRARENGLNVMDKLKLAESLLIVGEVLNKFEMFKIRPIPRLGTYSRSPLLQQKLVRPKGILLAQISEHTEAITCIEKVADQFFLSGSSDGTFKVFDSRKIQMNMTVGSEVSVALSGEGEERARISSISVFQRSYAAIVGSSKGHIRIYPIDRLPTKGKQDQSMRFNANGELQKLVTLSNELKNQCFCYVTAEGNLGVHDIRLKSRCMSCNIGRQRGIPRSLCATSRNSILVGTVDGYLVNFDIRFNVISSVSQLRSDRQALPITGIYPFPSHFDQKETLFALTYPGKHYEFSCFDLLQSKTEFGPERQYTSAISEQLIVTPFLEEKTSDQLFKLCRNGLIWRKAYEELRDFSKSFSIYDYLSDPLTRREAKIREIWLDNCKNRYNQISSLYSKKQLPFLQLLPTGILTCPNPTTHQTIPRPPFLHLTEKRDLRETYEVDRVLSMKSSSSHKIATFAAEEAKDYLSCCRVLPNMVVAGLRNSLIKVYV